MMVLALYYPQPQNFADAVFLLLFVYAVLCGVAYRMRVSVPLAAAMMGVGCAIALLPKWLLALRIPAGTHDYARQLGCHDCSDAFLAFTSYLHVGNGKLVAFAGMCLPLLSYAIIAWIVEQVRRSSNASQTVPVDCSLKLD